MLHIAAEESKEADFRFLTKQEMTSQAKSWPYSTDVPEGLIGIERTSMDVARKKSLESEEKCLYIVREVCGVSI